MIPDVTAITGVPVQLYANSTSELTATFSVSGPATLSGYMLTVYGLGPVNLIGYQSGDQTWGSTGPVSAPLKVLPARSGGGG